MYEIIETNKETANRYQKDFKISATAAMCMANRLPVYDDGFNLVHGSYDKEVDISKLKNARRAAVMCYDYMMRGDKIVFLYDLDQDGVSAAGVGTLAFTEVFNYANFVAISNERMYPRGVNDYNIARIKEIGDVKLVVTADQGSSPADNISYGKLKEMGIETIVTDHHELNEGPPSNAAIVVNNQQEGCTFSKYVSGCGIFYFFLEHLLEVCKENNYPLKGGSLKYLQGFVGVTTITDAMDMSKPINRVLAKRGLEEFNKNEHHIYQGITDALNKHTSYTEDDFGMYVGSIFNASGRLNRSNDVLALYHFRSAGNVSNYFKKTLMANNQERKKFQAEIMEDIGHQAKMHTKRFKNSLVCVAEARGSNGVNGVLSGMLGEKYNVPCIVFGIDRDGRFKGSGRGMIPGLNLLGILHAIQKETDYVVFAGGHEAACGVEIKPDKLYQFMRVFDEHCSKQITGDNKIKVDGWLDETKLTLKTVDEVDEAGPYGNYYARPTFLINLKCTKAFPVGVGKIHAVLEFVTSHGEVIKGFSINGNDGKLGSYKDKMVTINFSINREYNRGEVEARLLVKRMNLKEDV